MVDFINLTINKKDIIYDGKVKMTKGNKGVIRIKNKLFNNFTYVIFPILRQNDGGNVIISVDEILNKETHLDKDKIQIDFSHRYPGLLRNQLLNLQRDISILVLDIAEDHHERSLLVFIPVTDLADPGRRSGI